MEADMIWEKIRRREQELLDLEDSYYRQRKKNESRQEDIEHRRHALELMMEKEAEEMFYFLQRHSLNHEAVRPYFQQLEQMKEAAFYQYRQEMEGLFQEKDDLERQYRKETWQLEDAISQLRREYSNVGG